MLISIQLNKQKSLHRTKLKKLNSNDNAPDLGNYQSMFVLAILEKMKEGRLKFSQGSIALL